MLFICLWNRVDLWDSPVPGGSAFWPQSLACISVGLCRPQHLSLLPPTYELVLCNCPLRMWRTLGGKVSPGSGRGDSVPLLCACLASREMLIDGGTSLWRLNESLCSWLPCKRALLGSAADLWSIHLSQQLGSCLPTSFCTQMLRSFRICSMCVGELSSSSCWLYLHSLVSLTRWWLVSSNLLLCLSSWLCSCGQLNGVINYFQGLLGAPVASEYGSSLAHVAQELGNAHSEELLLS